MRKYRSEVSDNDLGLAEAAADPVLAVDKKLMAAAHSRRENEHEVVRSSLLVAEAY